MAKILNRYIAIDNVCAWPVLLKDPESDDIYAILHNSPSHGWTEGSLDCYLSKDGGHFWTYQGAPAPHKKGENRIHISAGWDCHDNMIVLSNGFKPDLKNKNRGNVRGIWTSISKDKGKTWKVKKNTTGAGPWESQIPFGRIHALAKDELLANFYAPIDKENSQTWSGISNDGGFNWKNEVALINGNDGNECVTLPLNEDGEILAATRTHLDHHIDISRSTDNGRSWKREQAVTLGMQHPGDLTRLSDNQILLTYAIRNKGMTGLAFRRSEDNGKTWKTPGSIVNLPDAKDFGYPSTVQLSDSTLVTAYYLSNTESHDRYHMGIVIWEL
jgi:hypothetical protein